MMGEIPEWALEKARQITADPRHVDCLAVYALARYIAEHEEPPVDPLMDEARRIAAEAMLCTFPDVGQDTLARIRSGVEDDYACVSAARIALRRGMELAKSEQSHD